MINFYIFLAEDLLLLCVVLILLYLFVLAVKSHRKHQSYPKAKKQHRYAILVSEKSILPKLYIDKPYEFIVYRDWAETIRTLDEEQYEFVILLSENATSLSPAFVEKILNAYDADVKAIQLHAIVENRKGFNTRFRVICNEIYNSLFRAGNTRLGLSSALSGVNMAIDLKWLKKNQKSSKTNLERKLLNQQIYIEYLEDAVVYCESVPISPYRKRVRKSLSFLTSAILGANWSFCNRIMQQLIPSPAKMYLLMGILAIGLTGYDWTLSVKWWIGIFALSVVYSLAIPDYLVEDKKKKKHRHGK